MKVLKIRTRYVKVLKKVVKNSYKVCEGVKNSYKGIKVDKIVKKEGWKNVKWLDKKC